MFASAKASGGAFMQQVADDPMLVAPTLLSWFGGPELAPPEAFADANIERIFALG